MMRSLRCSAGLRRASWHSRLRNTRTLRLKAFFDIKFDVSSDAFPECFHFMEGALVEQLIFQRSADFIPRRELSLRPFIEREIGRASCRERVCQYVYRSVVAVSLKKKG